MGKYKIGDLVEITNPVGAFALHYKGHKARITEYYGSGYILENTSHKYYWEDDEITLIKESNNMTKYYRVLKETPLWEVGAIVSNEQEEDAYRPINPVFIKNIDGITETWSEGSQAVENQPEWFEQVYPLGNLKKAMFGSRKQAQAAAAALYEGDKE